MASLPHIAPSTIDHTIATLYGDNAAMDAWHRSCVHAAEALRPTHDSARVSKALQLAKDGAVELASAGSALVTNGSERYEVQDGACACPDYAHRGVTCKHVLAVAIHRQALLPTAPAPALVAASAPALVAAPAPALDVPAAPKPKTSQRQQAAPASAAAWHTTEAPASCNIKVRVGHMELMYTARDTSDEALQARMLLVLPWYKELMEALEDAQEVRQAAKAAPAAPPAAEPPAPAPAVDAAELHTCIQQAVQQALGAVVPGGRGPGDCPVALPSGPAAADQQTGLCSLHQTAMDFHENEQGVWYSHYREEEQRYCKGAKRPRNALSRR